MHNLSKDNSPFKLTEIFELHSKDPLYNVVLFNDDVNFYGTVVKAVQRAIMCSSEVAEHITHLAHTQGKAKVTTAPLGFAQQVYSVLVSYKLTCEIQKV